MLSNQERLPRKYEKIEKLIKKIESLSDIHDYEYSTQSKELKLYSPWLIMIIALPITYAIRVLTIIVYFFVLTYFLKAIDWVFSSNIVPSVVLYMANIEDFDLYIVFVFLYIFIITIHSLLKAVRIFNYNQFSLLLWGKVVKNNFKKNFLEILTLRVKELDFIVENSQQKQEHEIICRDCGYIYYDENNLFLKNRNTRYKNFIKSECEV